MYKSLQAGRGLAAVCVFLFHLGGAMAPQKYFGMPAFARPFLFGDAGVEFFFVLSGFIIFLAHRHDIGKPRRLLPYLGKRITRIYPTYWMVFLAVYGLALSSDAWRHAVPGDVQVVLTSMMLIPQDPALVGGTGAPVIAVAWTLHYEVLFYGFFGLMIVSRWFSSILGLAVLGTCILYSGTHPAQFPLSFFATDCLLLFALGMGVAALSESRRLELKRPLIIAGAGAIMFSGLALDRSLQSDAFVDQRILLFGIASGLIMYGLVKAEDRGRILGGHRVWQVLGGASYVLYLIHVPLITVLCKFTVLLHLNRMGLAGAITAYLFMFCVVLATAVAIHFWIEKPLLAFIRRPSMQNPRIGG